MKRVAREKVIEGIVGGRSRKKKLGAEKVTNVRGVDV